MYMLYKYFYHGFFLLIISDSDIMISKNELHSAKYHLVYANIANIGQLESKLRASNIDRSLPTLFLSECVLVYIDVEGTDKLLKWISDSFPTALFLNYEQVSKYAHQAKFSFQRLLAPQDKLII